MGSSRKQTQLRWFAVIAYSALVALVSLGPDSGAPVIRIPHADKIAHFGMYFLQALLLRRAMSGAGGVAPRRAFVATALECSGYGLLLEFGQLVSTAGRSFEWLDAAANTAGAITGSFVFDWQRTFLMPRDKPERTENMEIL